MNTRQKLYRIVVDILDDNVLEDRLEYAIYDLSRMYQLTRADAIRLHVMLQDVAS